MDVHVPRAITEGLRLRGVDVLTAQEDRTARLTDAELLDRAAALDRVLLRGTLTCWWRPRDGSGPIACSPAWCMPISFR